MVNRNKDLWRRRRVLVEESRRRVLKAIASNRRIDITVRWWAQVKMSDYSRQGCGNRIKNFCTETGRSRSIINFYRLSRLRLRKLAAMGALPGLKKACW